MLRTYWNFPTSIDNFIPSFFFNKSWLRFFWFYTNKIRFINRFKSLYFSIFTNLKKTKLKKLKKNKIRLYKNWDWYKAYFNSLNPKGLFITNFLYSSLLKLKLEKKSITNKLIFKQYYIHKSHYSHFSSKTPHAGFIKKSTKTKFYQNQLNIWSNKRNFGHKRRLPRFEPKKIGLFNVYFGLRFKTYNQTSYNIRKRLFSLPDRNGPTWKVIREVFKSNKKLTLGVNYSWSGEWLKRRNWDPIRRSFMPKIYFHNSLYMYVRKRRVAVDKYFNLRFNYQKRMTRFLFQFKKTSMKSIIKIMGCTFEKVILRTGLLVNYNNLDLFYRNRWSFLNGHAQADGRAFVFKNDVISVYFNWYILKFLMWSYRKINKNRFALNRYYYLFLIKRRKRKTIQYWADKYKEINMKPLYFIERDFTTMTAFCLKDYDYNDFNLRHIYPTIPYGILFSFNWKFIT